LHGSIPEFVGDLSNLERFKFRETTSLILAGMGSSLLITNKIGSPRFTLRKLKTLITMHNFTGSEKIG